MRKVISFFIFLFLVSCNEYVEKPKNLLDKDTMAEIIADLAINDQIITTYQNTNLESGTRYILKTHNVKPADFVESYKYYVMMEKMNHIIDNAQTILIQKDPKAEKYIQDKNKNNKIPSSIVQ